MFDDPYANARKPAFGRSPICARTVAVAFVGRYEARLRLSARRIDADEGYALSVALCDMMLDGDVPPTMWPVDEMLELLGRDDARPCRQRDRIVADLLRIRELASLETDEPPSDAIQR